MLLLTGCRLGEIQKLKWKNVYLNEGYIHLEDSKTGKRDVDLNPVAVNVFRELKAKKDNPYVIYSEVSDSHIIDLQRPWRRIRKQAELEDVRIHDLSKR